MSTTIADLVPQVCARLEEDPVAPVFWSKQNEIIPAIVEGICELLLLIGRPVNITSQPYILEPNTIWQTLPPGMFCLTDIYGPSGQMYKLSLFDLDYLQASWQSSWENDLADSLQRWAPIGLTSFVIHPAVSVPQPVTVAGIQLVTTQDWPYSAAVGFPFQSEVESAIEAYAAHICRIKEQGDDFFASLELYKEFLAIAQRISEIQDRRDPYLFGMNLGVQSGVKATTAR